MPMVVISSSIRSTSSKEVMCLRQKISKVEVSTFTFPDESDLKDFADKGFKLFDLKAALSMYKRFKN
jgi:hypothetical protein